METADHDIASARTAIERQAIEILDVDPMLDVTTLVSHLDFSHWLHTDWHAKTELEPMLRALFLRELLACRDPDGSVQISWFHAKAKALIQLLAVLALAWLKQFENDIVRRFISRKTRSTVFRFPCFS